MWHFVQATYPSAKQQNGPAFLMHIGMSHVGVTKKLFPLRHLCKTVEVLITATSLMIQWRLIPGQILAQTLNMLNRPDIVMYLWSKGTAEHATRGVEGEEHSGPFLWVEKFRCHHCCEESQEACNPNTTRDSQSTTARRCFLPTKKIS